MYSFVWLLLLSMITLRVIHLFACNNSSFFFIVELEGANSCTGGADQ